VKTGNKVLLLILDGFGVAPPGPGNAITLAGTPNIDELQRKYPHTLLEASGLAVGLPKGQMGNSEVGHLNLGAGRIVYQKLTLINKSIEDGMFQKNPTLLKAIEDGKKGKLHLAGLCSDGGVHSVLEHLYEIVKTAKSCGVENVFVHAFLDGRDTPPQSAKKYIAEIEGKLKEIGCGKIATVQGRYFSMDRDNRWDRVKIAYDCLTAGKGRHARSAIEAVDQAYLLGETDEFVTPTIIMDGDKPLALIEDGDSFIHFNYRPDRARELTKALTEKDFTGFERDKLPKISYTCFAMYDETFTLPIIFTEELLKQDIETTLGKIVSDAGLSQLRIAETEKYAHVTYFLNGGREETYKGEDRVLVPSPKVPTYDLQPEMSCPQVEEKLVEDIKTEKHSFIVCNLANPDMVGHTGNIDATIKTIKQVDESTGKIVNAAHEHSYDVVIISDHGNAEQLLDENGNKETAHSTNLVPCIFIPSEGRKPWEFGEGGSLSDVTGLILYLLGLKPHPSMKRSILVPDTF